MVTEVTARLLVNAGAVVVTAVLPGLSVCVALALVHADIYTQWHFGGDDAADDDGDFGEGVSDDDGDGGGGCDVNVIVDEVVIADYDNYIVDDDEDVMNDCNNNGHHLHNHHHHHHHYHHQLI